MSLGMMNKYRVWLRSKPGFFTQYDGHVDVWAYHINDAEDKAIDRLRKTSFPDRNRGMWIVEKVEIIG